MSGRARFETISRQRLYTCSSDPVQERRRLRKGEYLIWRRAFPAIVQLLFDELGVHTEHNICMGVAQGVPKRVEHARVLSHIVANIRKTAAARCRNQLSI